MKHDYSEQYGQVKLLPLDWAAAEKLRILRNRNSSKFVDTAEISPEAQSVWYERYLTKPGDYMFSVYSGSTWVGAVSIYDVDASSGTAEFGRLAIDHQAAGRHGLGLEATKAACELAFRQLHLQKLRLEVYNDNIAALITYLKAGFLPVEMQADHHERQMVWMERIHPDIA